MHKLASLSAPSPGYRQHDRSQSGRWHLRHSMALLVAACVLPGALVSAYFVIAAYEQRKEHALSDAVAVARAAGAGIDRDLAGVMSGLRVLATSSALDTGDLATFHAHAQAVVGQQNITNYVLIDRDGRQLVNTLRPMGAPLPGVPGTPQLQQVIETGAPIVSDLFLAPLTQRPIVAIGVPVVRDGHPIYSLGAFIAPERISAALRAQRLPPDWIVSVLDSHGTLVTRSHDTSRYVGQTAAPDLIAASRLASEGQIETTTPDGVPVYMVFSRSSVSDWTFAIGIPRRDLTAGLRHSLVVLLLADLALMALALWVAWRLALKQAALPAERLLDRMNRMSQEPSHGLPAPRPSPDNDLASWEFAALEQGFDQLCERLSQREAEREALHQAQTARTVAEAANRSKTEFLSRMSHELRTPLNAVLGFAQLLRMQTPQTLDERQLAMVENIESSGRHLLDMINDVLDISRIEAGTLRMSHADVDALAVTRDCLDMVGNLAAQAGVRVEADLPPGPLTVRSDAVRLKQVLLNLLSNAIKYNRAGGTVVLRIEADHPVIWLRVRDDGPGLTPDQQQHLFEPFNRLGRENSTTPGTGIGLVISKRLVEAMGGQLVVRSDDRGSEFALWLHAADPGSAPSPTA
ncbi:sensor histidine kinase [Aquabacterium sp.]|uniref:sensor histidine kinase n=1 Tax=Aquabacterium sp. TaxID=1872578 RepID=UPI0035B1C2D2